MTREQGLFVGISAAAAGVAALIVGWALTRTLVVVLPPDGGFQYTSDSLLEGRGSISLQRHIYRL